MKAKFFIICIILINSCASLQYTSSLKTNKQVVMIASTFLQKITPEYYEKYCINQSPTVENRLIESGKYKGLVVQIVTFNYPQTAQSENPMFIEYAVKVYINGRTGKVITKIIGPDGLIEIYENDVFNNFTPNILKLTK